MNQAAGKVGEMQNDEPSSSEGARKIPQLRDPTGGTACRGASAVNDKCKIGLRPKVKGTEAEG